MTATNHDLPNALADFDAIAFLDPAIGIGQLVHAFAEKTEARLVVFDCGLGKTRGAIEPHAFRRRFLPGIGDEIAAQEIIRPRHPQLDVETADEPARKPDMV